jgi:hypothetical protein
VYGLLSLEVLGEGDGAVVHTVVMLHRYLCVGYMIHEDSVGMNLDESVDALAIRPTGLTRAGGSWPKSWVKVVVHRYLYSCVAYMIREDSVGMNLDESCRCFGYQTYRLDPRGRQLAEVLGEGDGAVAAGGRAHGGAATQYLCVAYMIREDSVRMNIGESVDSDLPA